MSQNKAFRYFSDPYPTLALDHLAPLLANEVNVGGCYLPYKCSAFKFNLNCSKVIINPVVDDFNWFIGHSTSF
jgi:hypothetical protein